MTVGDIARDAQPQAIALLLAGQAKVRFEHLLQALFGHPGPFVIDVQHKGFVVVFDMQMGLVAILEALSIRLPMQRRNASGLPGKAPWARPSSETRPLPLGGR